MAYLRDCPSCASLVRNVDSTCPFCGASLRSAVAPSWLVLGLTLGLAGATVGCEEKDEETMTESTGDTSMGDMTTGEMTTGTTADTTAATMSTDSDGTGATTMATSDTTATTTTTTTTTTSDPSASASGTTYAGPDEVDTIDAYAGK